MSEQIRILYNGRNLNYQGRSGYVAYYKPSVPFEVISDDDWDHLLQYTWASAVSSIGNYYANVTASAKNSMLYRKVKVLSDVTISSYWVDCNQTPTNISATTQRNLYPSCEILLDKNLASSQIFDTTGRYGGLVSSYRVPNPTGGTPYTWGVLSAECNATLHGGEEWWWPMFVYRHNVMNKTQFSYHNETSSEMLALRNYNNTTDTAYPPQTFTANYRPWLILNDTNGNSWSV